MSSFDLIVAGVILVSAVLGWVRGGIRELVTLLSVAAGFLAVGAFGASLSEFGSGTLQKIAIVVGVFFLADMVVQIFGSYMIRRHFGARKKPGDNVAGGMFGAVRGWVLASVLVLTIELYHRGTDLPPMLENSALAPHLSSTARFFLRNPDVRVTELSNADLCAISPSSRREVV